MNQEIKPEVEQLIAKGYTVEQISEILGESEDTIHRIRVGFIQKLERENNNETSVLSNKQVVQIYDLIYDILRKANIHGRTKGKLRKQIIEQLTNLKI